MTDIPRAWWILERTDTFTRYGPSESSCVSSALLPSVARRTRNFTGNAQRSGKCEREPRNQLNVLVSFRVGSVKKLILTLTRDARSLEDFVGDYRLAFFSPQL